MKIGDLVDIKVVEPEPKTGLTRAIGLWAFGADKEVLDVLRSDHVLRQSFLMLPPDFIARLELEVRPKASPTLMQTVMLERSISEAWQMAHAIEARGDAQRDHE